VRGFALERCLQCGLVFANPRYPPETILDGYREREDMAAFYDERLTPERVAEIDRVLAALRAELPAGQKLLDFGCGPGYFIERAAQSGWEAHGVEPAAWAQEAAHRRKLPHLHQGRLADQRFPDAMFDVVASMQVIEHLADPLTELREVCRVLRPGGLLYANVPNYRCLSIVLGRDDFDSNFPMGHLSYFTPATLSALMKAAGFTVLRTATYGGLKWENLFGCPARPAASDSPPSSAQGAGSALERASKQPRPRPSWKRRMLSPLIDGLLYRRLQVGRELEIFARRPDTV
jgi:2-polyprenyl-3-methyl-5-hydroxy-6-metoxy-1,4-benzoquinol methylase